MNEILKTTLIGMFFGTFGTTIGGLIGITFEKASNKFLSFILALASGLMTAVVCFDLIPEAMQITNITNIIIGTVIGVFAMIVCDSLVQLKFTRADLEVTHTQGKARMKQLATMADF